MATSRRPGTFLAAPAHLTGLAGAVGALGMHVGGVLGPTWWIPAAAVYGLGALVASRRGSSGTGSSGTGSDGAPHHEPPVPPRRRLEDALDAIALRNRELGPRLPRAGRPLLDRLHAVGRAMLAIPDDDADPPHLRFVEAALALDDAVEALDIWRRVRQGAAGHPDAVLTEQLRLVLDQVEPLLRAADGPALRAQREHTDHLRRRVPPPEDPHR